MIQVWVLHLWWMRKEGNPEWGGQKESEEMMSRGDVLVIPVFCVSTWGVNDNHLQGHCLL